ncbi:MAG: hypothetical protein JNM66_08470 [Bryobacterales bacterium]|nr:hypothetical protein [Bryobacterales bacterium]
MAVTPTSALLGQDIVATLRCVATGAGGMAPGFRHASLVLELRRKGSGEEPVLSLPNVSAVVSAGRLIRTQASGGVEEFAPGETREAVFPLLERFPQLLRVGEYTFSYRLEAPGGGECEEAAVIQVKASAESIPHLVALCDGVNGSRAAALLRKFTGVIDGSPQEVEQWWRKYGRGLALTAEGRLGRPKIALSGNQIEHLTKALGEKDFGALDEPPPPFVFEPNARVTEAILAAIDDAPDAAALCRFLANYPEASLAEPLRALEPASARLLDWLAPGRVKL